MIRKIAFTNFVLSRFRRAVGAKTEVYVKWWYGGAFNGAAYMCENEQADANFFSLPPSKYFDARREIRFGLTGTRAYLNYPESKRDAVSEAVNQVEPMFVEEMLIRGTGVLNQVQRLQMWILFETTQTAAESASRKISRHLTRGLEGTPTIGTVMPFIPSGIPNQWEMDLEMVLTQAEDETKVIRKLREVLPNLKGSLFGYGADCGNHDGKGSTVSELKCIHLVGRQF